MEGIWVRFIFYGKI